jgi:hypothetical protein
MAPLEQVEAMAPVSTALLVAAIVHTFCAKPIAAAAHRFPEGSKRRAVLHLLAEIELTFALWSVVLVAVWVARYGVGGAWGYVTSVHYGEAVFVFVVMVVAWTRPVMSVASRIIGAVAARLPVPPAMGRFVVSMIAGPLLGSLITEPAAMTVTALLVKDVVFRPGMSVRFRYATLGLLLVNVSIGGTLTNFAAPPVLMVASRWDWSTPFMLTHFGWRALVTIIVGTLATVSVFRKELARAPASAALQLPKGLQIGAAARVALFLAGLVTLGSLQSWWLTPLLTGRGPSELFWGSLALTSVTDNAAITYLATLVPSLDDAARFAVVAGAVAGGGLTVIANAPNPVGFAILAPTFGETGVSAWRLFLAAMPFTLLAALLF